MKKAVGSSGSFGSEDFRKSRVCGRGRERRCRATAGVWWQRLRRGRRGRLRSGESRSMTIGRAARFGSFSPSGPVFTVRGDEERAYPAGGRVDDEFGAAARRDADVIASTTMAEWQPLALSGDAVKRHHPIILNRAVVKDHRQIYIGDRGSVQRCARAASHRASCESCRRVVGIGNRNVIDREIFRGLAESGAVVGDVAVVVDQRFRDDGLALRGKRGGI